MTTAGGPVGKQSAIDSLEEDSSVVLAFEPARQAGTTKRLTGTVAGLEPSHGPTGRKYRYAVIDTDEGRYRLMFGGGVHRLNHRGIWACVGSFGNVRVSGVVGA